MLYLPRIAAQTMAGMLLHHYNKFQKTKGDFMAQISEIAPDVFRICTYFPEIDLQFNQFLVRDEQPLLFHTGLKELFPAVREAVSSLIDPATIRWIGFSHVEADECATLRD